MDVASYYYREKVHRRMHTAVVLHFLKINESQYITLFVVSVSIKSLFSTDCVNIYFSQSKVSYLFPIDLKVWGYPKLLISRLINFKHFYSFSAAKLNNIGSENEVFAQECSYRILRG